MLQYDWVALDSKGETGSLFLFQDDVMMFSLSLFVFFMPAMIAKASTRVLEEEKRHVHHFQAR